MEQEHKIDCALLFSGIMPCFFEKNKLNQQIKVKKQ